MKLFWIPFFIQAVAMVVDEFYFHHRRGLPLWEVYGHPVDTFTVLLCYGWVLFFPYSSKALTGYFVLSVLSCLMITKDEWIHRKLCSAEEQWLHAILFVLHPVVLGVVGYSWSSPAFHDFGSFLTLQSAVIFSFMIYQFIYWRIQWRRRLNLYHSLKSTTPSTIS